MKVLSQATIALLISTVSAQSYLNNGVLYYGQASLLQVSKAFCDNPGSSCNVDLCCGTGIPDSTVASNLALIPVQFCYTPPTGATVAVKLTNAAPLLGDFVFKCNSYQAMGASYLSAAALASTVGLLANLS